MEYGRRTHVAAVLQNASGTQEAGGLAMRTSSSMSVTPTTTVEGRPSTSATRGTSAHGAK